MCDLELHGFKWFKRCETGLFLKTLKFYFLTEKWFHFAGRPGKFITKGYDVETMIIHFNIDHFHEKQKNIPLFLRHNLQQSLSCLSLIDETAVFWVSPVTKIIIFVLWMQRTAGKPTKIFYFICTLRGFGFLLIGWKSV